MTGIRVAGAPISWGVCEVPGWGHQLAADQVLAQMRDLGLEATEFGPDGFLPVDPVARSRMLHDAGLRAVGGFLSVVLHDASADPVPQVEGFVEAGLVAGADVVVLAAATGTNGYDHRRSLDEREWSTLLANLDRIADATARRGAVTALHPHVGTVVERAEEVARVLRGSTVGLCVDTGHLLAGGTDPVALVREDPGRVVHVHLKDLDAALAAEVRAGRLAYAEAIPRGLFTPLGQGGVDVSALVRTLIDAGYDGWFVLEQDVMLAAEPVGEGPAADVRTSLDFLRGVIR
jgi:inosose dehydratase